MSKKSKNLLCYVTLALMLISMALGIIIDVNSDNYKNQKLNVEDYYNIDAKQDGTCNNDTINFLFLQLNSKNNLNTEKEKSYLYWEHNYNLFNKVAILEIDIMQAINNQNQNIKKPNSRKKLYKESKNYIAQNIDKTKILKNVTIIIDTNTEDNELNYLDLIGV